MLLILLLAGCGDRGGAGKDSGYVWAGCDVAAALSVDEGPPVAGDVPLTVTLSSPAGEPARVDLKYSLDGETWEEATFEGEADDLATSAAGETCAYNRGFLDAVPLIAARTPFVSPITP